MGSKSPGTNANAASNPDYSNLPRGILGRRGVPIARGARLPSVRSPRDLTLGGAPQKRTFTPNIPVRKEKKEIDDSPKPETVKRDGRRNQRQRGSERGRGRGRGRGTENLIQLQGSVFGEGPMAIALKKAGGGRYDSEGGGGGASNNVMAPKYTPKGNRTKAEIEEDERMLEQLYKDDFIDDLDDKTKKFHPVQLPLSGVEVKKEVNVKPTVKIKKEPRDNEDEVVGGAEPMEVDGKPAILPEFEKMDFQEKYKDLSASQIFTSQSIPETGNLLLFQFPDCLPGAVGKSDDDDPAGKKNSKFESTKNAASTSKAKEDKEVTSSDSSQPSCSLADLPEGFIGKLQVLKSGKCRLSLGSIGLKVELGTNIGFLQELVSIHANDKDGDLIVLGGIQRNLICHPDMDTLLKDTKGPT